MFSSIYRVSLEMLVELGKEQEPSPPFAYFKHPHPLSVSERYLLHSFVTSVLLPNNIDFRELIWLLWIQLFNGKPKVVDGKGTCGVSSVGRVEYDLGDRCILFRFPIEKRFFFLFGNDHTGSSPHRTPVKIVPGLHPLGCGNGVEVDCA